MSEERVQGSHLVDCFMLVEAEGIAEEVTRTSCEESNVDSWVMDSGASFHATHSGEALQNLVIKDFGKVRLADDRALEVTGMGDMVLKTVVDFRTLKDVRVVPALKKTLISVRELDEQEHEVKFRDGQRKVVKGNLVMAREGKKGYDDWKIMMEAHLYALHDCMWMVLEDGPLKIQMENPERNPANPDVVQYIPKPKEKWDDRDCKKHNLENVAKAGIFKTLDPITFFKIKHLKTAMEIWQGLGKQCEGSEDLRKQKIEVLLEKFKSFKMLPGESFDMLDERFHKILNDLASLNHVLSPKEKNVRLLRSLPTKWYTKATAMEEGRNLENYTIQGLLDELRTYEHELMKKKEEQVTLFPTALMTTPRVPPSEGTCPRNCDIPSSSQPPSSKMENYDEEFTMMVKQFRKFKKFFKKADSVRRPSKGKPQVSDSLPESYLCYNCRKPGHWKSVCPYPKVEKYGERERNEKKKKAMVAAESDESSSSSSDKEALVCIERRAEKSNHEDQWTMSEDDTLWLMAKDDVDQELRVGVYSRVLFIVFDVYSL
ncbi:unnamed protein product [Cuscuta campestris]|uniref:CCHC-type domain-containing protein n=1 Tax=Cuscuta campestris TaxID=132261 RepID=A0A484KYC3_9ASTE|nr:unnamed protein product [Cuscuta campestris]